MESLTERENAMTPEERTEQINAIRERSEERKRIQYNAIMALAEDLVNEYVTMMDFSTELVFILHK